ncbi:hypothetical protein LCGC14_2994510 [marine sediment metagenome]|uniref:Uncharacterized protein n=1 Tax=marine sediment metagenome TaxID=412755 RepID=A0A0F8XQJ3_9ZZZZ
MGAGHRDAEQKALLCGVDEGPNMTELEEAQEEVREAFCVACAGCSEDITCLKISLIFFNCLFLTLIIRLFSILCYMKIPFQI